MPLGRQGSKTVQRAYCVLTDSGFCDIRRTSLRAWLALRISFVWIFWIGRGGRWTAVWSSGHRGGWIRRLVPTAGCVALTKTSALLIGAILRDVFRESLILRWMAVACFGSASSHEPSMAFCYFRRWASKTQWHGERESPLCSQKRRFAHSCLEAFEKVTSRFSSELEMNERRRGPQAPTGTTRDQWWDSNIAIERHPQFSCHRTRILTLLLPRHLAPLIGAPVWCSWVDRVHGMETLRMAEWLSCCHLFLLTYWSFEFVPFCRLVWHFCFLLLNFAQNMNKNAKDTSAAFVEDLATFHSTRGITLKVTNELRRAFHSCTIPTAKHVSISLVIPPLIPEGLSDRLEGTVWMRWMLTVCRHPSLDNACVFWVGFVEKLCVCSDTEVQQTAIRSCETLECCAQKWRFQ